MELPPRARRILADATVVAAHNGTTSACAENTGAGILQGYAEGNYLRVRGEYAGPALTAGVLGELPPRARRIRSMGLLRGLNNGTTSACAENTCVRFRLRHFFGNYLRVRGEYLKKVCELTPKAELPPRARRIPGTPEHSPPKLGTTSACAENTIPQDQAIGDEGNYLRVRGEYHISYPLTPYLGGTTSACAENTD